MDSGVLGHANLKNIDVKAEDRPQLSPDFHSRASTAPSRDAARACVGLASALLLVPALLLVTPVGDDISLPARKLQWHATR